MADLVLFHRKPNHQVFEMSRATSLASMTKSAPRRRWEDSGLWHYFVRVWETTRRQCALVYNILPLALSKGLYIFMFQCGDFSLLFTIMYRSHKSKGSFKCHICICYLWETPDIVLFWETVGWPCKTPVNKKKSSFSTVTHLIRSSKEQEKVCRSAIVTT